MPFIARGDSGCVAPHEVTDSTVECICCGSEMRVRESHVRSGSVVARHFYHTSDSCGYESEKHLRVKSAMAGIASEIWPNAGISIEKQHVSGRVADVIVEFKSAVDPFGEGICIEVQYANNDKDKDEVTSDYISENYSVWWVDTKDYDDGELAFQRDPFDVPENSFRYSSYKTMKERRVVKALENGPLLYSELGDELNLSSQWTRYLCWSLDVFGSAFVGSIETSEDQVRL